MRTIIETLSDECGKTQDPEVLTSLVRPKLGRMIIQNIVDADSTLGLNLHQLYFVLSFCPILDEPKKLKLQDLVSCHIHLITSR